jgi:hypothetical protein
MVCTKVPPGVYSSRNNAVAAELSAATPSPTRAMTRSPGENAAAKTEEAVKNTLRHEKSFFIVLIVI